MQRRLLLGVVCGLAATGRAAVADEPEDAFDVHHEQSNKAHFLAARYDLGGRGSSYGLGYLHAWEFGASINRLGAFAWFGSGLELRLATADHDSVDGLIVAVPARMSGFGHAGGGGLELSAGVNTHGDVLGVATAGIFYGVYFVDIGYSYQFAIGGDRPDWLASHQFSVRLQIPVYRYDRYEKTERRRRPPRTNHD